MQLKPFTISQLNFLLPATLINVPESLQHSISAHGILVPPVICGNTVCDGHRRISAGQQAGLKSVMGLEIDGSPGLMFAELNSHRELSACEAAIAFKNLDEKEQTQLLKQTGISESPQMIAVLRFIGENIADDPDLAGISLPVNIWRELGHLGAETGRYARSLLLLQATVAEKRNIAALLRQAQRRNELPEGLPGNNAAEIIAALQKSAQPRRSSAIEKYESAVRAAGLPAGVSLRIDPTFAQPGIQATIQLTRNHTARLEEARKAIDSVFAAVPEL